MRECDCAKCRAGCTYRPGLFAPGEATKAAKEMGLSLKEFFAKYLVVNYYDRELGHEDGEPLDIIAPGWTPTFRIGLFGLKAKLSGKQEKIVGRRVTESEGYTGGRCALLGKNGCMLSYKARPEECRRAYMCEQQMEDGLRLRDEVLVKWRALKGVSHEISAVLP